MYHQYTLEQYSGKNSRYECPNCGKQSTFSRYIDAETGEHLDPSVGRCNREVKCGYHYTPKEYFGDHDLKSFRPTYKKPPIKYSVPSGPTFIEEDLVLRSMKQYDNNHFVTYLISIFGMVTTQELINMYFLATSSHWSGATIFWQVDKWRRIRTGKVMLYDPHTGKRIKVPFNHISWIHTLLNQPNFTMKQCLFGELLIEEAPHKTIALVESEKTAIIASGFIPEYNWLATGGMQNLNATTCQALIGRKILLFPDLGSEDKWREKMAGIQGINDYSVSDLLQRLSTVHERSQGLDIADFLVRQNYFEVGYLEEEVLSIMNPAKGSPEERLRKRLIA